MKTPSPSGLRVSTWPEARAWALVVARALLALLALAVVALLARTTVRYRIIADLEARGGTIYDTEIPRWLGHLLGDDARSCGNYWIKPPPSRAAVFLREQLALGHRCGVALGRSAGDSALAVLSDLPCITDLQAPNAAITDGGLRHLRRPAHLEGINLHGTRISGEGLEHLRGFPSLRRLVLSDTHLDDVGLAYLDALPALQWLDLSGTRITGAALFHLSRFPALRSVDLAGTAVDDAALRALAGMPLTRLILRDTALTEAAIGPLQALPDLEDLDLCGTRVPLERARRELSARLAACP